MTLFRHNATPLSSIATLAVALSACGAFAADIILLDEATPRGSLVRLGDVATIDAATTSERDRLRAMPLMPVPPAGADQFLAAVTVRELLTAQGESLARHRLSGAYRVRVKSQRLSETRRPLASEPAAAVWRPTRRATEAAATPSLRRANTTGFRVPPGSYNAASGRLAERRPLVRPRAISRFVASRVDEAIRDAAQDALDAARPTDSADPPLVAVEATVGRSTQESLGDFESHELMVRFPGGVPNEPGEHRGMVRPLDRPTAEESPVVFKLLEQRYRVVATRPLRRGELVTGSAIAVEPVPREELDDLSAAYESLDEAVGQETTRSVRTGVALSDANCAGPMLVRRDDEVSLVSGGGGVLVRMIAIARGDGRRGDLVPVEALDRRDRFTARVVGPREVTVLSGGLRFAGATGTGGLR